MYEYVCMPLKTSLFTVLNLLLLNFSVSANSKIVKKELTINLKNAFKHTHTRIDACMSAHTIF